MATRLIELRNQIVVEAEISSKEAEAISSGSIRRVESSFDQIQPVLISISNSIGTAWKNINSSLDVEQAEIELGLSFNAEGNIFVTKATANANLKVKLVIKPKST